MCRVRRGGGMCGRACVKSGGRINRGGRTAATGHGVTYLALGGGDDERGMRIWREMG